MGRFLFGMNLSWSREQKKAFENAVALYSPAGGSCYWERIASHVEGKSMAEIKQYFWLLSQSVDKEEEEEFECRKPREGIDWTEDEHRLFLKGLEEYGKGDWRSIAHKVVKTKTRSQVASHAQKYFNHLKAISMGKTRKRSSIFDIQN